MMMQNKEEKMNMMVDKATTVVDMKTEQKKQVKTKKKVKKSGPPENPWSLKVSYQKLII